MSALKTGGGVVVGGLFAVLVLGTALSGKGWALAYVGLAVFLGGAGLLEVYRGRGQPGARVGQESAIAAGSAVVPLAVGVVLGFGSPLLGLPLSFGLVLLAGLLTGTGASIGLSRAAKRLLAHSTLMEAQTAEDPLGRVQEALLQQGGGSYLGAWDPACGEPVASNGRGAVAIIGGPGSGKTRSVIVPSVMAHAGPVVSVSTKPEVALHTCRARAAQGACAVFDPAGTGLAQRLGVPELRWSPVDGAEDWEVAQVVSRGMCKTATQGRQGGGGEHFAERAGAVLGAFLFAAARGGLGMSDLLHWVLTSDFESAATYLEPGTTPAAVVAGLEGTPDRERGSIMSTAAAVLSAYQGDAAVTSATPPGPGEDAVQFDPGAFVASPSDTIYVVGPASRQDLLAPIIVGLLTSVREATYALSAEFVGQGLGERRYPPVLMSLDEAANIAPMPDLPSLCSEAGGQGLQVQVVLQDLSQARSRWGPEGEGLLSLVSSIAVLPGLRERQSLEALSLLIGDWDRPVETTSTGESSSTTRPAHGLFRIATSEQSGTTSGSSWTTHRERIFEPSAIAQMTRGDALLIVGSNWDLMRLEGWDEHPVWKRLAEGARPPMLAPARAPGPDGDTR